MIAKPLLPPRRRGSSLALLSAMETLAHGLADAIAWRKGIKAVLLMAVLLLLAALFLVYTILKVALWIVAGFFRLLRDVALKAHANQQSQQAKPKPARAKKPKVKVKARVHRRQHRAHVHPFVWFEIARIFERGRLPRHPRQKPN